MSSNLHPIFQQALQPFLHPPKPARCEFVYEWNTDMPVPVVCHLEYERGERQTHWHPGSPAAVHLNAAYVRDVDIKELLSDDQIADIEERALISYES